MNFKVDEKYILFLRKFLLYLVAIVLTIFIVWRVNQLGNTFNLLLNSGFETIESKLNKWQVINVGKAQSGFSYSVTNSNNRVLSLDIPETDTGSGGGVRQKLTITPLQRYQLKVKYQFIGDHTDLTNIILRVTQFDHNGELVSNDEALNPVAVGAGNETEAQSWQLLVYPFITDEQTTAVELGIGFFGNESILIEIDDFTLTPYPTSLNIITHDTLTFLLVISLAGLFIYSLVKQLLWLVRWKKVFVNTGLVTTSLLVTLIGLEVVARFIPFRFLGPAWPPGYHVPFMEGQSYRLAKNYPPTLITNEHGDQNLVVSNTLGLRDVEPPSSVDDQTIILILGDSMTFGVVGNVHESWPRLLDEQIAKMLPEPDRYHFVNAGVTGYNTFQEVLLFQELIKDMEQQGVKPKIVLLSFFSRIWGRNLYGPEGRFTVMNDVVMYSSVKRTVLTLPQCLIEQSQIDDLKLISPRQINNFHQTLLVNSRLYFVLSLLLTLRFDYDWDARPDVNPTAINRGVLLSFKEIAETNNIQPVIAYLPGHYMFETEQHTQMAEFAALAQSLGFTFINPYENMQKLGINEKNAREKLTLGYDSHYSVAGNKLYVEALTPLLIEYLSQLRRTPIVQE